MCLKIKLRFYYFATNRSNKINETPFFQKNFLFLKLNTLRTTFFLR